MTQTNDEKSLIEKKNMPARQPAVKSSKMYPYLSRGVKSILLAFCERAVSLLAWLGQRQRQRQRPRPARFGHRAVRGLCIRHRMPLLFGASTHLVATQWQRPEQCGAAVDPKTNKRVIKCVELTLTTQPHQEMRFLDVFFLILNLSAIVSNLQKKI